MVKKKSGNLFDRMRSLGGRSVPKSRARQLTESLQDRLSGGPEKRKAAAKKAARTRKQKARKRSEAAKKAARTRAKA